MGSSGRKASLLQPNLELIESVEQLFFLNRLAQLSIHLAWRSVLLAVIWPLCKCTSTLSGILRRFLS